MDETKKPNGFYFYVKQIKLKLFFAKISFRNLGTSIDL